MRLFLLLALTLASVPSYAQRSNFWSTKAGKEFEKALTDASYFGVPRYTTAALPTCGSTNEGALAFDTTTDGLKVCDGSSWATTGGLTSPVSGDYVWTGKGTWGTAADAANSVRLGETAGAIVFEGSGANTEELTLTAENPGSDVTVTIPATTTTLTGNAIANVLTGANTFGSAANAANSVRLGETAGSVVFEGATADDFETTLGATDATVADQTYNLPNAGASLTSTIAVLGLAQTFSTAQTFSAGIGVTDDQYVINGNGSDTFYGYNTTQTPDALFWGIGADSRGLVFAEVGDFTFDFAHAQQTNPTVFIHSANQSTTQWISLTHNQTNGVIDVGAGAIVMNDSVSLSSSGFTTPGNGGFQGTELKADAGNHLKMFAGNPAVQKGMWAQGTYTLYLPVHESASPNDYNIAGEDGAGTNIAGADLSIEAGQGTGTAAGGNLSLKTAPSTTTGTDPGTLADRDVMVAKAKTLTESAATAVVQISVASEQMSGGVLQYTIRANDASDVQARVGSIYWAAVNDAGTEVCTVGEIGTSVAAVSTGTLTVTWTCATTPTNAINLEANAVSSLTQTTLEVAYRVTVNGPGVVTPQ